VSSRTRAAEPRISGPPPAQWRPASSPLLRRAFARAPFVVGATRLREQHRASRKTATSIEPRPPRAGRTASAAAKRRRAIWSVNGSPHCWRASTRFSGCSPGATRAESAAALLHIAKKTVDFHRGNLMRKLGADSLAAPGHHVGRASCSGASGADRDLGTHQAMTRQANGHGRPGQPPSTGSSNFRRIAVAAASGGRPVLSKRRNRSG
jgi:regulatory LuxR family protein